MTKSKILDSQEQKKANQKILTPKSPKPESQNFGMQGSVYFFKRKLIKTIVFDNMKPTRDTRLSWYTHFLCKSDFLKKIDIWYFDLTPEKNWNFIKLKQLGVSCNF